MPANVENGRSLANVVAELKEEFKQFVSTRAAMLQSEMRDKVAGWKAAAPMAVIGVVVLGTAWLLLTAALVSILYVVFQGSPYAMFLALIIVFAVYAVFGAFALLYALSRWRESGMVPQRTLRVLKDDQIWISNEARAQL